MELSIRRDRKRAETTRTWACSQYMSHCTCSQSVLIWENGECLLLTVSFMCDDASKQASKQAIKDKTRQENMTMQSEK